MSADPLFTMRVTSEEWNGLAPTSRLLLADVDERPELHRCRTTYNDFCRQPCVVCGLEMPPWCPPGRVKVAHHRDPESKQFSPSELSRRSNKWWEILVGELRKCEPVCANCHGIVHDIMVSNGGKSWAAWQYGPERAWDIIVWYARAEVSVWRAPGLGLRRVEKDPVDE